MSFPDKESAICDKSPPSIISLLHNLLDRESLERTYNQIGDSSVLALSINILILFSAYSLLLYFRSDLYQSSKESSNYNFSDTISLLACIKSRANTSNDWILKFQLDSSSLKSLSTSKVCNGNYFMFQFWKQSSMLCKIYANLVKL